MPNANTPTPDSVALIVAEMRASEWGFAAEWADRLESLAAPVCCDVVEASGGILAERVSIEYADKMLREYQWDKCRKANFLYALPTPGVPVERVRAYAETLRARAARKRQCGLVKEADLDEIHAMELDALVQEGT